MGKKRRILIAALLAMVVGGLAWVVLRGSGEPVYRGKTLNYWLRQEEVVYSTTTISGSTTKITEKWVRELPVVDARAVPFLARALQRRDGALQAIYTNVWPKLPLWMQNRLPEPVRASLIRENAAYLLSQLHFVAKPALPVLVQALEHDDDEYVRSMAMDSLLKIDKHDPRVIAALNHAAKDTNAPILMMQAGGVLDEMERIAAQKTGNK